MKREIVEIKAVIRQCRKMRKNGRSKANLRSDRLKIHVLIRIKRRI
jgi:hypothetical protein